MPADKLITVFDWGYTNTLNSEAKACIDYAYHGYFGSSFMTSGLVDKTRWSPVSTNLGSAPNAATLNSLAKRAKAQGYGAFMFFNLRRSSNVNPLNGFNATASGLYGLTVTCENGDRLKTGLLYRRGMRSTWTKWNNSAKRYVRIDRFRMVICL